MRPGQRSNFVWIWFIATAAIVGYWLLFADATEQRILAHTLALAVSSAIGAVLLGGLWSFAMWGQSVWQVGLRWWALAATLMPIFLHLSVWDAAIGKLGWITADTNQLFQPLIPRWLAAWWVHATATAPAVGWLLVKYLQMERPASEQQALLEYSPARVFWLLTIVRLRPVLWVGGMWALLVACREIAVTDLYQIGTLAEQIYLGFSLAQPDRALPGQPPEFWHASWLLQLLTIGWIACSSTTMILVVARTSAGSRDRLRDVQMPHRGSLRQAVVAGALGLVFVAVPLVNLVLRSCLVVESVGGSPQVQYHLSAMIAALGRVVTEYRDSIYWSGMIALWGGCCSLTVGMYWAWQARQRTWVFIAYWLVAALVLALPGPLIGSFYFQIFDRDWGRSINRILDRTILLPVLATVTYCWPIVAILCWQTVREVPQDTIESAQLDGVPRHWQLWTLLVRGTWPRLIGWLVLVIAWMFGELSASQMVLPPGIDTVPRLMLGFLHAGVDEMTAAMSLWLILLWLTIAAAGQGLVQLNNRRMVT